VTLGWAGCGSDDTSGSGTSTTGTGGSGGGVSPGGSGGTTDTEPTDPRYKPLVAAIQAEMKQLGAPGVAVAVIEDGKVTFSRGFGSKDPSKDDPVAATTLFRTGSVNKMLTAAGLLGQVAKGKVSLDQPVTTYVPDFHFTLDASWAPTIQVKHLLTHSTGMYDYLEVDVPASQKTDAALETFMTGKFADADFLMNPSGAFWNYSNPNFMMAGLIAEKTSGKTYRQLMKEDVFAPLGMDRTYFLGSEVIADGDYALGVTSYPMVANPVHPDTYDNAWARPAGYATSSVLDLAKFAQFLLDGNEAVLPKALVSEMQSPVVDTQEFLDLVHYGYGLFATKGVFLGGLDKFYTIPLVQHGGDIPGFAADLTIVPSLHFGFIAMANADGAHFTSSLVTAITTLNDLPAPATPPDLTPDPSTFGLYEGTYQDDINAGPITVTKVGDNLEVSMPNVDQANIPYEHVLTPRVGANFLLSIQGTQLGVTFIPDAGGVMRYFRTRVFVGTKAVQPPPPPVALEGGRREAFLAAIRRSRPSVIERLTRP
jgi:CubicO group peptidase (beta-lactamase class C family)